MVTLARSTHVIMGTKNRMGKRIDLIRMDESETDSRAYVIRVHHLDGFTDSNFSGLRHAQTFFDRL